MFGLSCDFHWIPQCNVDESIRPDAKSVQNYSKYPKMKYLRRNNFNRLTINYKRTKHLNRNRTIINLDEWWMWNKCWDCTRHGEFGMKHWEEGDWWPAWTLQRFSTPNTFETFFTAEWSNVRAGQGAHLITQIQFVYHIHQINDRLHDLIHDDRLQLFWRDFILPSCRSYSLEWMNCLIRKFFSEWSMYLGKKDDKKEY